MTGHCGGSNEVIFLFLVATSTPLFAEIWMERSFKDAVLRLGKQCPAKG